MCIGTKIAEEFLRSTLLGGNMSNERFNYNKGDIEFKRCQCAFCRYNCKDENGIDKKTCPKYPDGKPDEVLQTKIQCPFLEF